MYNQTLMNNTVRNLAWNSLQRNIIPDGGMDRDKKLKKTDEVLAPEVDYNRYKVFKTIKQLAKTWKSFSV